MVANKINLSLRQTRTYFTLIKEKGPQIFCFPKDLSALFFLFDPREKKNNLAKPPRRKGMLSIPLCVSPSLRENRKTPIAEDVNFYTFGILDLFL